MKLENKKIKKYALVTGGSRGIGREICVELSKELGYSILINYNKNKSEALNTLKEIKSIGGNGEIIQFDVSSSKEVINSFEKWRTRKSNSIIEVLVNNAGITKDNLFMFMKKNEWDDVINISLNGFFNVTNYLIKEMLMNRYGRIINIVSLSGLKGNPGQTNYSAAKGGVIAATKSLAQEVARRNITVNAVAPGFIKTDMTSLLNENELKKIIPVKRFGEAIEVAKLVCFLASKNSSYITGEVININGGLYS